MKTVKILSCIYTNAEIYVRFLFISLSFVIVKINSVRFQKMIRCSFVIKIAAFVFCGFCRVKLLSSNTLIEAKTKMNGLDSSIWGSNGLEIIICNEKTKNWKISWKFLEQKFPYIQVNMYSKEINFKYQYFLKLI